MMVKLYFMDEIEEKLFGRAWGRVSSLKKLERFEFSSNFGYLPKTRILAWLLKFPFLFDLFGTPGWVRTSGFQLRRLTLYPLSYGRFYEKSEWGLRQAQASRMGNAETTTES